MKLYKLYQKVGARTITLIVAYTLILVFCRWISLQLRFDFEVPTEHKPAFADNLLPDISTKFLFLALFRQFSGVLGFFSVPDLLRLAQACLGGSCAILLLGFLSTGSSVFPRGALLVDFVLSLIFLTSLRVGYRLLRERFLSSSSGRSRRNRRIGIIGAGDVGANLAREFTIKRGLGMHPVAFFDDNPAKWKSSVHNVPVIGKPELLLDPSFNLQLEEIAIAMPSAPPKRLAEVVSILQKSRLKFTTVPSLDQLASGTVKASQLRSVELQDLLSREPVKLELGQIREILTNKVVLVTGAGGSIGSELCRQVLSYNPSRLVLVEHSEFLLFQIEQELRNSGFGGSILPIVADIGDEPRMRFVLERSHPTVVFHAAAHKHVPMMEAQPAEAIKNNTLGTITLAKLSSEYGVKRFILISTDKAINPTNVMGATKRLAEIYLQSFQAFNQRNSGASTKFMAVRFGNVLGSSGSVIPTFNRQIALGGPVKVTHADVTRYFMTIPEAVSLVLQSAAQGSGGEIFVLDMGQPVKILDLAKQLIELNGLKPDEDIMIEFTGLRPGEKLFEELSHHGANIAATNHPKILCFLSQPAAFEVVESNLREITHQMYYTDPGHLKIRLQKLVPEYQPYLQ